VARGLRRSEDGNGCLDCPDSLIQRKRRGALLRKPRHMDETDPGACARVPVQQRIEDIVAHKGTGRIGDSTGKTGFTDGIRHLGNRNRGKVRGGAIRRNHCAPGLISRVVRNPCVPDVDGNPLRRDAGAAARLPDTQNHVGQPAFGCSLHRFRSQTEDGRDHQLSEFEAADGIREAPDRLPRGVDRSAVKGVEAGDQ